MIFHENILLGSIINPSVTYWISWYLQKSWQIAWYYLLL